MMAQENVQSRYKTTVTQSNPTTYNVAFHPYGCSKSLLAGSPRTFRVL